MKLVKGMLIGAMATAGIAMIYMENNNRTKKNLMKRENKWQERWESSNHRK